MTRHNPTPGVQIDTDCIAAEDHFALYEVKGNIHEKDIKGELTMKLDGQTGGFDGWDWKGTELTESESQLILDLFAD